MARNGQNVGAASGKSRAAAKPAPKPAAKVAVKVAMKGAVKTAQPVKVAKLPAKPAADGVKTPKQEIPKPAKAAVPATDVKEKVRKPKLVRDSFTMPEDEYAALGDLKKSCLKAGIAVKKSELLRVGVALLRKLDTAGVKRVLDQLPTLKAGRPKKGK